MQFKEFLQEPKTVFADPDMLLECSKIPKRRTIV